MSLNARITLSNIAVDPDVPDITHWLIRVTFMSGADYVSVSDLYAAHRGAAEKTRNETIKALELLSIPWT